MSDIVRVVEEEFDDEGNLVRRTTTEYGQVPFKFNSGGVIKRGVVLPGEYIIPNTIVANPETYMSWNDYNYGTYARRAPGGTDRDIDGMVTS